MVRTSPEIEAIKTAVKPLTPEERARIKAIRTGEAPPEATPEEEEVEEEVGEALKARARALGVRVTDLTEEQVAEVKASQPAAPEEEKSKKSKK